MSLQDNHSVVDYDLDNLLQSTAGNHAICEAHNEKLKKSIAFVKGRIIQVHNIFKHADKCTKDITEKDIELQQTRNECIEALQKISLLEKENESLQQDKATYNMQMELLLKTASENSVENEGLKATIKQYKDLIEADENRRRSLEKEIEIFKITTSEKDKSITSLKALLKKSSKPKVKVEKNTKFSKIEEEKNDASIATINIEPAIKCKKCDDIDSQKACISAKDNDHLIESYENTAGKDEGGHLTEKIKCLEKEFSSYKTLNSSMVTFIKSLMELKKGTVKSVGLKCEKYLNDLHKQYSPNVLDQEDKRKAQGQYSKWFKKHLKSHEGIEARQSSVSSLVSTADKADSHISQGTPTCETNQESINIRTRLSIPPIKESTWKVHDLNLAVLLDSPGSKQDINSQQNWNAKENTCTASVDCSDIFMSEDESIDSGLNSPLYTNHKSPGNGIFSPIPEYNEVMSELALPHIDKVKISLPISPNNLSKRNTRNSVKSICLSPIKEIDAPSTPVNVVPIIQTNLKKASPFTLNREYLSPVKELEVNQDIENVNTEVLSPITISNCKRKSRIDFKNIKLSPIKELNVFSSSKVTFENVAVSPIKELNTNIFSSHQRSDVALSPVKELNPREEEVFYKDVALSPIRETISKPKKKLNRRDVALSPIKVLDSCRPPINDQPEVRSIALSPIKDLNKQKSCDNVKMRPCKINHTNSNNNNNKLLNYNEECNTKNIKSKHTSPKAKTNENTKIKEQPQFICKITSNEIEKLVDPITSPVKIAVTENIEYSSINIRNILDDMKMFRVLSPIPSSDSNEPDKEENNENNVKNTKRKKLTKLQKMRNACIIKPKIKLTDHLNNKILKNKKIISSLEVLHCMSTNKEDVYEKAAKIAAIERIKENENLFKKRISRTATNKQKSTKDVLADPPENAICTSLSQKTTQKSTEDEPEGSPDNPDCTKLSRTAANMRISTKGTPADSPDNAISTGLSRTAANTRKSTEVLPADAADNAVCTKLSQTTNNMRLSTEEIPACSPNNAIRRRLSRTAANTRMSTEADAPENAICTRLSRTTTNMRLSTEETPTDSPYNAIRRRLSRTAANKGKGTEADAPDNAIGTKLSQTTTNMRLSTQEPPANTPDNAIRRRLSRTAANTPKSSEAGAPDNAICTRLSRTTTNMRLSTQDPPANTPDNAIRRRLSRTAANTAKSTEADAPDNAICTRLSRTTTNMRLSTQDSPANTPDNAIRRRLSRTAANTPKSTEAGAPDNAICTGLSRTTTNMQLSAEETSVDSPDNAIRRRLRSSHSESIANFEPKSPLSIPILKSPLHKENKRNFSHTEAIDGKVLCVLLTSVSDSDLKINTSTNAITPPRKKCNETDNLSIEKSESENKLSPRVTRRAKRKLSLTEKDLAVKKPLLDVVAKNVTETKLKNVNTNPKRNKPSNNSNTDDPNIITYSDLDLFVDEGTTTYNNSEVNETYKSTNEHGIFIEMLKKYGRRCVNIIPNKNQSCLNATEKLAEEISNELETAIRNIQGLKKTKQVTSAMFTLQKRIITHNQNAVLLGVIKFVMSENRRSEELCTKYSPPAPAMTKPEQILVFILAGLKPSAIEKLLNGIEYTVFRLGHTPDVYQVEQLARLFAVLCRRMRKKRRLRLFMLDALYCISYKAVPLIRQCLNVWMNVLPLAHMNTANNPLVLCLVYLLYFYKCSDFQNNVYNLRVTLQKDYAYDFSKWSQEKILEHFRNSVLELKNNPIDMKSLRLCLILLGKRHGTAWSEKHIVNSIVMPLMEDRKLPIHVNHFCAGIVGALLRPFPPAMNMLVHVILTRLENALSDDCTPAMEQALVKSIICLNKNLPEPVFKILNEWKPRASLSPALEQLFKEMIREKPTFIWLRILSNLNK